MKHHFDFFLTFFILFTSTNCFSQSVKASTYGFNNPSEAIREALFSNFDTIIVDTQNKPWLLMPMRFGKLQNKVIVLEQGTEIRALPGAFPKTNDALLTFIDCKNITIIGNGAQIAMNKSEYREGEWRHGISIRGCTNIKLEDLTICDTGGDGVYVAGSKMKAYSENIYVDRIKSINNRRQGITLISVKDIVIRNSLFKKTSGTLPGAGLDIEPNKPSDIITGVKVYDCVFSDNYGSGIMLAFGKSNGSSKNIGVTFKNCVLSNNNSKENPRVGTEIRISANKDSPVKGKVIFEECLIENSRWGLLYSRKRADAFNVVFKNCTIKNTSRNGKSSTVYLEVPDYYKSSGPLGGYEFDRLYIKNDSLVNFMTVRGSRLGTLKGVQDIIGSIIQEGSNPKRVEYINYDSAENINLDLKFITKH